MCSTCGCKDAESFQAPIRPDDELCVSCGKDEVAIKSNLCEECQKGMGIKKINARRLAQLGWTAESLGAETSIAQEYSETIDDIEDLEEQVKKTVAPKRKPTKYLREAKGSVMDSWKQMRKDGFRKEMYDQYIKDAEDFGAESCTCNDMFGSLCPQCNYDSDREGGVCPKGCTVDLAGSVRPQEMEIYTECKIHGQKLGAEGLPVQNVRDGISEDMFGDVGQGNNFGQMRAEEFQAEGKSGLPWMTFAFIGLGAFVASRIKTVGFKAHDDCGCGCSGKSDCGDEKKADEGHYPNTYDPVQDFLPRYRYPEDSDWSNSYNPADPYRPLDYQTVQTDSRTTADRM